VTKPQVYKVLGPNGKPFHGGRGKWSLPKNGKPGSRLSVEGDLVACRNGIHLCRRKHLLDWLGPCIYLAEYRGEMIDHHDKLIVRHARLVRQFETWNDRTARLFACDCAERVVHLYESEYPKDKRPRKAIEAARLFANGKITRQKMAAEAAEAARAAGAAGAARAAGAAGAAWAARAAWAAGDAWAARAARAVWAAGAAGAAWAAGAARAARAARAAERKYQTKRLFEYLEGKAGC
jgi:hypothetical protein